MNDGECPICHGEERSYHEIDELEGEVERLRKTIGRLTTDAVRTSAQVRLLLEQNRLLGVQRDAARGEVAYWQERRVSGDSKGTDAK